MLAMTVQIFASGTVAVVSFLLTILLGRVMGPAVFGDYSFMLSVASLFFILQDGGYKAIIYREETVPTYTREMADKAFPEGIGHLALVTGIGLLVCLLPVWGKGGGWTLASAVVCFALVAYTGFISARLQARGRFGRDAAWQILVRLSSALCMAAALVFVSPAPRSMFLAWGLGSALCALCAFKHLRRPRIPYFHKSPFVSASFSLLLVNAATTLYHRLDIIMLDAMTTPETTGMYAASYRFLDGPILLAAPVSVVLFRRLRRARDDSGKFSTLMRNYSVLMLGTAATLLVFALVAGDALIRFTYGPAYTASAALLPILFTALVFILPNSILTQSAIAANNERGYAIAALCCAGFNAALNAIVIPHFGAHGAAWATVATEAVLTVLLLKLISRASPPGNIQH